MPSADICLLVTQFGESVNLGRVNAGGINGNHLITSAEGVDDFCNAVACGNDALGWVFFGLCRRAEQGGDHDYFYSC